tara:strand:+ start:362 stop:547 length:186 start_codon:yes stop_codon:yes gene_type:complete
MNKFEKLFKDFYFTSKEDRDKRWDICKDCPELTKRNRCKQCGCFMKIKIRLNQTRCPIDKW